MGKHNLKYKTIGLFGKEFIIFDHLDDVVGKIYLKQKNAAASLENSTKRIFLDGDSNIYENEKEVARLDKKNSSLYLVDIEGEYSLKYSLREIKWLDKGGGQIVTISNPMPQSGYGFISVDSNIDELAKISMIISGLLLKSKFIQRLAFVFLLVTVFICTITLSSVIF